MKKTISYYNEVARYILLNASFTTDIGLFRGKMGVAIFFAQYARITKELIWDDYAGILIDEVYSELHSFLPVNFEDGYCGIGFGIEFLVQNGYMEGDTSEILGDIDICVMERDPERIKDYTLGTGLAGILLYAYMRMFSAIQNNRRLPFDAGYRIALSNVTEDLLNRESSNLIRKIAQSYKQLEVENQSEFSSEWLWEYLLSEEPDDLKFSEHPLGLLKGLSGFVMRDLLIQ